MVVCVCWRLPPGSLPSPAGDAPRMFLPSSRLLSLPGNGAKEWGGRGGGGGGGGGVGGFISKFDFLFPWIWKSICRYMKNATSTSYKEEVGGGRERRDQGGSKVGEVKEG